MEKYTKEEIKENRRKVAEMAKTEGWPLVKDMVNTFVLETEREIMIASAEDKDKMLALANKLKFGTGALLWFIQEVEKIREGLDN
jgi:hypothetical protein